MAKKQQKHQAKSEPQLKVNKYDQDEATERPFDKEQFMRLLGFLKPHKRKVVVILGLMLILTVTNLAGPYLMKIAVDVHIAEGSLSGLSIIGIAFLVIQLITYVASRSRTMFMSRLGQDILFDMRHKLFTHIQKLSFKFYDSRPAGKIMVRITNDVNQLNNLLTAGLVNVITDIFSLSGIIIIMFWMNAQLALYSLTIVPLLVLIGTKLRRRVRSAWRQVRYENANINANLQETLSGVRVVQSFNREKVNLEHFKELNGSYYRSWMRAMRVNMVFGPAVEITQVLGAIIVYWFGARMLFTGDAITVGDLIAFIGYLGRFWAPISHLSNVYNQLLVAMASAERVFEILDYPVDIGDVPEAQELPKIKGRIDFKEVNFGYDADRIVLHDVNLSIEPGKVVALVGPTGAGKSSIINLVCRFYDPVSGRVEIDGHDIRQVHLADLRKQLGIVLQDTFLFSGTIKDNIRYGKLNATDREIIAAARAVNAHDFIMQFENGYDTEVQERGSKLSVGQRQLIAFARALLADPRILILDEATSSIDTHTEKLIQDAINVLLDGRTSFIIAHRLSTIREADIILVVDDGRIIEQGTHEELLLRKGVYHQLNQAQFKYDQANIADD